MNFPNVQRDNPIDTADLVRRAQGGDQDAFGQLVASFHARVLGFVSRVVADRDLADEVAQDVFLAAYQSLGRFQNESSFSTWLLGIAKNKSVSAIRKQIARRRHEQNAARESVASLQAQCWQRANPMRHDASIDSLQRCMEKMKPEHRRILERHYRDNESAQSISHDLGRSGSGIRMMLMRLRESLRECMKRELSK